MTSSSGMARLSSIRDHAASIPSKMLVRTGDLAHDRLLSLSTTSLFLLISPLFPARAADPEFSKGVFTVAGTVQGVSLQQVANGLGTVTSIANAGDGRLFLTVQAGRIRHRARTAPSLPQPFLDIRDRSRLRRRARPAHGRVPPAVRAERPLLRLLHRPQRQHGHRPLPRLGRDPEPADPASARILLDHPRSRSPTTTAASSSSAPTAISTSAWATAAPAATPTATPSKRRHAPRQDPAASTSTRTLDTPPYYAIPARQPLPRRRRAAGRDLGLRPAQPLALLLRPPDRRPLDRRRRPGRARGDRLPARRVERGAARTTAGRSWRGPSATPATPARPRRPACDSAAFTPPVLEYDHGAECSVTGGYVYRGDGAARSSTAPTSSATSAPAASGPPTARATGCTVRTHLRTGRRSSPPSARTATASSTPPTSTASSSASPAGGRRHPVDDRRALRSAGLRCSSSRTPTPPAPRSASSASARAAAAGSRSPATGTATARPPSASTIRPPRPSGSRTRSAGGAADHPQVDAPSAHALPIAGDWDGDGKDTVGLYDPATRHLLSEELA